MITGTLRRLLLTSCMVAVLAAWSGRAIAGDAQPSTPRAAVPDAAAQQASEGVLRDLLGQKLADARTPQAKAALARQLLATDTGPSAGGGADGYVLPHKAMSLAEEGGDVETALRAADAIARGYDVDTPSFLADALRRLTQTAESADDCALGFDRCRALAEQAVGADEYDAAEKLAAIGKLFAGRSRDAALVARAQTLAHNADEVRAAFMALHHKRGPHANPEPADTTAEGKFLCFMKGQWNRGLPLLASGRDSNLQRLAAEELSKPTDGQRIVQLAGQWLNLSQRERGIAATHVREHALQLYREAAGSDNGLAKLQAQRRTAELQSAEPPAPDPVEQLVVEALIDGNSELHITPRGIYWLQLHGGAKPGRHNGANEPTFINGRPWMPLWQNPKRERDEDRSALLPLPMGRLDFDVQVLAIGQRRGEPGVESRDPVTIRAEHLEQVVSIPDTQFDARWYRVRIYRNSPEPSAAKPVNTTE